MTSLTRSDWEQRAKTLTIETRAFIHGEYRAAESGATFECISPVDGRLLATRPMPSWRSRTPAPPSTPARGPVWRRPSARRS